MPVSLGAAADHGFEEPLGLLSDCHRRIERFLEVLWKVASERRGGGLDDEQRRALRVALDYFRNAAPRHTEDEEDSLFPRLRSSDDPRVAGLMEDVARLEADHRRADALHERVHVLADDWLAAGRLSPAAAGELVEVLAGLRATYREHIRLEDEQVFPLAAELLTRDQLERVGAEMADRRGVARGGPPAAGR